MSINEIKAKAAELKELKAMQEELAAEISAIEDEIKQAMGDQEQIIAGGYKITWKAVTSSRFDSTAFKKVLPELYKAYTKQTTSRRFTISV